MNLDALKEHALEFDKTARQSEYKDVYEIDCELIKFILENCDVAFNDDNAFFGEVRLLKVMVSVINQRKAELIHYQHEHNLYDGDRARAYLGDCDYGHTSTEWETVLPLGIYGLRERLISYAEKNKDDENKQRFYNGAIGVYDSVIKFMKRVSILARELGKTKMADGIDKLTVSSPTNLFEAMQTYIVYYFLQQEIETTRLRSFGRLDKTLYPFYQKEDKEYANKLIREFYLALNSLRSPANLPFAICGTELDGSSSVNELSYELVKAYKELHLPNVKIHVLTAKNTPRDLLKEVLDGIRQGKNSFVFMNDEKVIESLLNLGEDKKDAVNYHVVGCYEPCGYSEIPCSCNGRVNIVKALEYALNDGVDVLTNQQIGLKALKPINSYADLYEEFTRQLKFLSDCAMKATDLYEEHDKLMHGAPIFSSTYVEAVTKGGDIYCDRTAKYFNSSINVIGLATATDSLYALKKVVFEDKKYSLKEFNEILVSNWKDNEFLRLTIKNKLKKFGNNDDEVDSIAKDIMDDLAKYINKKPNVKGGLYRLGIISIDWRWEYGEHTGATADGRFSGETLSQNASATFGTDKESATSHLLSVAKIDSVNTPNGNIVDIDIHYSAVSGESGLNAMLYALLTFINKGGYSVHYNVLNTDVLIKAKKRPQDYPNLQVRLCGWNVLFSTLSEKEKDDFINRSTVK